MVEVVNYSAGEDRGLTAHVEILNMDGSRRWDKTATLDSIEDGTSSPIQMEYPEGLSATHFVRLSLTRGSEVVSTNFYLRGLREGDYRAIRELPPVKVEAATRVERAGARWLLTTELRNVSQAPAFYSDNYVALMPGERQTIRTEIEDADTRGERPRIVVEGFNVGKER